MREEEGKTIIFKPKGDKKSKISKLPLTFEKIAVIDIKTEKKYLNSSSSFESLKKDIPTVLKFRKLTQKPYVKSEGLNESYGKFLTLLNEKRKMVCGTIG